MQTIELRYLLLITYPNFMKIGRKKLCWWVKEKNKLYVLNLFRRSPPIGFKYLCIIIGKIVGSNIEKDSDLLRWAAPHIPKWQGIYQNTTLGQLIN